MCNRKEQALKEVNDFISLFTVIPISGSLLTFAEKKAELKKKGCPIDDFDLLIGATAVTNNLILVTENTKHFNRITDLQIENWIKR